MNKKYKVTCWLNCEWCFTRNYDEEDIVSIVYHNMKDETYGEILDDLSEAKGEEVEKFDEDHFIKCTTIYWNGFEADVDAMSRNGDKDDVAIIVTVVVDIDAMLEMIGE